MALGLAGAVQGSLEQSMLTGERRYTQETMVRIKEEKMVIELTLFASDGLIAASSEVAQLGQKGDLKELDETLQLGKTSIHALKRNGLSELSVITPVLNKSECQSCHSPDIRVLGAVKVSLDATLVDEQARQQAMFLGILAVVTFLIIGGGLAFTLKATTLNRLSRLAQLTKRISQGDYSARAESNSSDEIGMLAYAFNEMAAEVEQRNRELEISRQELAQWNADLESKIQQRTKEITGLNSKLEEMNRVREQLLGKLISAQEQERQRIARELHDNASQSLAAVAINLGNIADILPARYHDAKEKLTMLKEQTIQTLGGIRNLALELRPSVLDDLGLFMAIDWYARDYLGKRGLDVKIEANGQKKLPPYTETMLFRIIQEALTNIVKHAEASQVKVRLSVTEAQAIVEVEDNGKGFDVDKVLSREGLRQTLGIHGMVERAALLNGTFTIKSQPGKGTSLRVEVPLTEGGSHE